VWSAHVSAGKERLSNRHFDARVAEIERPRTGGERAYQHHPRRFAISSPSERPWSLRGHAIAAQSACMRIVPLPEYNGRSRAIEGLPRRGFRGDANFGATP
jgi:hypothetical protein